MAFFPLLSICLLCSENWYYDLRKKAMEALDEGESRETVAARFKIGRTIVLPKVNDKGIISYLSYNGV
ncbi:hypothetical protein [Wolbachia endosymbiont (group A) of Merzomyia westermanni]|uniref:hypothetical protein n=1 Tax=Wolbachia endosymbiont (group A) of Merzomyia westermanni TaxID=2954031 RepID=UPI0022329A67|nr:hypothetical protein [Wolbachia endosymbiont (group A) of Merzomyia westermanni]